MDGVAIAPLAGDSDPSLVALALAADPDPKSVQAVLSTADVLVASAAGGAIGLVALAFDGDSCELKIIAVGARWQGRGLGKRLVESAIDHAAQRGARSMLVGTGNSSISQIAFYQKCGFRMSHVKRDHFADYPEPIFENGIRCRDMLYLRQSLHRTESPETAR